MSFKSQPPVVEGEKEVVVGIKASAEKLSNDVACWDDFSPDFSSEHVDKASSSNGDVWQNDDEDSEKTGAGCLCSSKLQSRGFLSRGNSTHGKGGCGEGHPMLSD